MSIFKASGIVLNKIHYTNENSLCYVFTKDFGKISISYKKSLVKKNLDIGNIINFEVKVNQKNELYNVSNLTIINQLNYDLYSYDIILEYLNIIATINKFCPLNHQVIGIFDIINEINQYKNITKEKIIYLELKVLYILGLLELENENIIVKKILSFISKSKIPDILKLKGIDENSLEILENIIKNKT